MNTKEAWLRMINQKGIHEKLGIASTTLYWLRSQAKEQDKFPTRAGMEDQLEKAGWKVVVERKWKEGMK